MREAVLQKLADLRLIPHQVAHLDQQVDEVQLAGALFTIVVFLDQACHLIAELRRHVRIRPAAELFDPTEEILAARQQFLPGDAVPVNA